MAFDDLVYEPYGDVVRGTAYVGECPGCGRGIKSYQHDGYCAHCVSPSAVARPSDADLIRWAGQLGEMVVQHLATAEVEALDYAARHAASYALDAIGRGAERRAA